MRAFVIFSVALVLVVIGLLLYPSIHTLVGLVDTTGFLPLTIASIAALPYIFLGFIVYAILKVAKK